MGNKNSQVQAAIKYLDDHSGGDPWRAYVPESKIEGLVDLITKLQDHETKARNYAWCQSLEKGARLCRRHTHEGDAQTLEDIVKYLNQTTSK